MVYSLTLKGHPERSRRVVHSLTSMEHHPERSRRMAKFHLKVAAQDQGLRLDQYIIKNLSIAASRSQIQHLIKRGEVLLNQSAVKAHYKVRTNDSLIINISPKSLEPEVLAERIPLEIIFEDQSLLVINKPAGMVTHPAQGNYSQTLVNALLGYGCRLSKINGPLRPGIVHRLDKDTSGLMVVAKEDSAHQKLARQFSRHTIKRKYIALAKGNIAHNEGVIELPIARDRVNRQKMAVSFREKAKYALTRYKVIKRYAKATLVELTPHTGRTHQLRVHLKFLGHPILGDSRYGRRDKIGRLALHAKVLGFNHPRTGKFMEFQSEAPDFFRNLAKTLK